MADILMITAIAGAENCAAVLSKQFEMRVETVASRKEAVAALGRHDYQLVILDESMIEGGDELEQEGDNALFRRLGLAVPLEVNFAVSGAGRLVRAVRAALGRREREREIAARGAALALRTELREAVSGLLLQAQLALSEPGLPAQAASRLQVIAALAARLCEDCGLSLAEDSEPPRTAIPGMIPAGTQPGIRRPQRFPSAPGPASNSGISFARVNQGAPRT